MASNVQGEMNSLVNHLTVLEILDEEQREDGSTDADIAQDLGRDW